MKGEKYWTEEDVDLERSELLCEEVDREGHGAS